MAAAAVTGTEARSHEFHLGLQWIQEAPRQMNLLGSLQLLRERASRFSHLGFQATVGWKKVLLINDTMIFNVNSISEMVENIRVLRR